MKRILYIIIIFISFNLKGQDPSFSQFDLNMLYHNPAFSGYEGSSKILLHSRNQWNKINEKFNNSIFELNTSVRLNPNNRNSSTWGPGISVLSEDLGFKNMGNTVFVNKTEVHINNALHKRLDIPKWGIRNFYGSVGFGFDWKNYSLDNSNLIFTDQWTPYGQFNPISGMPINQYIHNHDAWDASVGIVLTKQGRYTSTQVNRIGFGQSLFNIRKHSESFSNTTDSTTTYPLKHVTQIEWLYGIPIYKRPLLPYIKTIFKHERYINNYSEVFLPSYWKQSIISKTEYGITTYLNNTPFEFGVLFRNDRNFDKSYHLQTIIFPVRLRKSNGKHLWVLSYSYDMNISSLNRLSADYTGTTNEVGLAIYLFSGRNKNGDCPAFGETMKNSALYKDIYNNGLINNKKPGKNWRNK